LESISISLEQKDGEIIPSVCKGLYDKFESKKELIISITSLVITDKSII
jgi:hypothetical protein